MFQAHSYAPCKLSIPHGDCLSSSGLGAILITAHCWLIPTFPLFLTPVIKPCCQGMHVPGRALSSASPSCTALHHYSKKKLCFFHFAHQANLWSCKHQPDIATSMPVSKCLCSPLLWAGCAAGLGESTERWESWCAEPGLDSSTNKSGPWDSAAKLVGGWV